MREAEGYWVFDWLRENSIVSLAEATAFLPKYRVLSGLQQRAELAAQEQAGRVVGRTGPSIIAGMGMDLSGGRMVCPSPSCMREQVDKLLKHVWHYFDAVVVDDVLTPLLSEKWGGSKKGLVRAILAQLAPLLYIEEIGAAEFVRFRAKSRCVEHWEQHAVEEGLQVLLDARAQLVGGLIAGAKFRVRRHGDQDVYEMECADSEVGVFTAVGDKDEYQAKTFLAGQVFAEYMVDLVADVSASRECRLPLGSAQAFVGRMLQMSRPVSVADVIFQLDLPVIEGVPTAALVAIRRDESEYFSSFRNALSRAARERLELCPGHASAAIADEIRADVIEPELEKIRLRLATAESSLAKKSSAGIFLGALATTCGLLSGVVPALALSAGVVETIGVVGPAASKHIDEQRETSLSDMYFLWKAMAHAHGA